MRMFRLSWPLIALAVAAASPAFAEGWYAAIAPNNDLSAPVAWGKTEREADDKAVAACRKVSDSCSNKPARTGDREDVFALMCCENPKTGCAIGVGKDPVTALSRVQAVFLDAGYSRCKLDRYLSAKSGKEVQGD